MTSTRPIVVPTTLIKGGEYYLLRSVRGDTAQDCIAFAGSLEYRLNGKVETSYKDDDIERIAINLAKIVYIYREDTDDVIRYNTETGVGYIFLYLDLYDNYSLIVEKRNSQYITKFSMYDAAVTKMNRLAVEE